MITDCILLQYAYVILHFILHIYLSIYLSIYLPICLYIYMCVYTYIYTHICMYDGCMYVCMYVCIYLYIYIYIYIFGYTKLIILSSAMLCCVTSSYVVLHIQSYSYSQVLVSEIFLCSKLGSPTRRPATARLRGRFRSSCQRPQVCFASRA